MVNVSLIGIPHDENSSFMRGAAEAPPLIRRELHSDAYSSGSETGIDLGAPSRIVDHGDIAFGGGDPWDPIEQQVGRALDSGHPHLPRRRSGHQPSDPARGAPAHASLTILQIDAHPDIYDAYQGNPRSHTSPMARIMEERLCDRLIQVGLRAVNDHHRAQFKRFGVEAGRWSPGLRLDIRTPVYISMDIDGLDPAHAPGVSHREPGGSSPRQVIDLFHTLDQPIVAADIVEFNPRNDIANMTAPVAAKLLKEIAGMIVKTAGR